MRGCFLINYLYICINKHTKTKIMRTIKTIIPNEKAAEFEFELDGLFDAEDRISDTNQRDFWTVFLIMVKNDAEQCWVDLLEVEFNK